MLLFEKSNRLGTYTLTMLLFKVTMPSFAATQLVFGGKSLVIFTPPSSAYQTGWHFFFMLFLNFASFSCHLILIDSTFFKNEKM